MKNNLFLLIIFFSCNTFAQQDLSTTTFNSTNTNIIFEKSRDDNKVTLNYSLRWDFKELKKFYYLPVSIYKSFSNMDARKDIKLKYYGYKISPVKLLIKPDEKKKINTTENQNGSAKASKKNKNIFILSPLYDDITENLNDFIINKSMEGITDKWKTLKKNEKKEFINDLYKLDIWQYPILNEFSSPLKKYSEKE